MLIVFAGLPGTGKTTIARELALRLKATYLRIDTIEQAVRDAGLEHDELGAAGYIVAYALAEANLEGGRRVVADCVNSIPVTRMAWQEVAVRTGARLVDIEVVCSDAQEHKRRVETRKQDIKGLMLPTWQQVMDRDYAPWPPGHFVLDTAILTAEAAVTQAEQYALKFS